MCEHRPAGRSGLCPPPRAFSPPPPPAPLPYGEHSDGKEVRWSERNCDPRGTACVSVSQTSESSKGKTTLDWARAALCPQAVHGSESSYCDHQAEDAELELKTLCRLSATTLACLRQQPRLPAAVNGPRPSPCAPHLFSEWDPLWAAHPGEPPRSAQAIAGGPPTGRSRAVALGGGTLVVWPRHPQPGPPDITGSVLPDRLCAASSLQDQDRTWAFVTAGGPASDRPSVAASPQHHAEQGDHGAGFLAPRSHLEGGSQAGSRVQL